MQATELIQRRTCVTETRRKDRFAICINDLIMYYGLRDAHTVFFFFTVQVLTYSTDSFPPA